jgi:hypothetical protein
MSDARVDRQAIAYLRAQATAFGGRAAIIGKGPSMTEFDVAEARRERFVIGLNEVPLRAPCHAAFVIDEDILERQGTEFASSGIACLITPRAMHRTRKIGGLAVYQPSPDHTGVPAWRRSYPGPVAQFNLGTAAPEPALGETVPPYNFSAPTLAHLLAITGFTDIRLAGVDGGTKYAGLFREHEYKKLRSLQDSFDVQFDDLRKVRDRFDVRFSTARCDEATVLIGGEPEQILATEVLKWSIDTSTCLKVRYIDAAPTTRDLFAAGQAGTPFSFQRLYLPRLAGHRGRGVYFDSDMLVTRDVIELFNWPMGEEVLLGCEPTPGRKAQFSVFLVDNARALWNPDDVIRDYREGRISYQRVMEDFAFAGPTASTLPAYWNSLESYEPDRTANVHFTDMGTQPWLSIYNPLADVWCEALLKATRERAAVRDALTLSLERGWVRPSLGWQVEHGHGNPWTLPRQVRQLDRNWLPPHALASVARGPRVWQVLRWQAASRIRRAMQTRTYRRLTLLRTALRKML